MGLRQSFLCGFTLVLSLPAGYVPPVSGASPRAPFLLPLGLDDSWSVYVLEAWGPPLHKHVATIAGSDQEKWVSVEVGHGDTLAVRDGETSLEKPAIFLLGERPVRGWIGLYSLKKLEPDSPAARDFRNHLQRAFQRAVNDRAWTWPEGGINLLDSVSKFHRVSAESGEWRVSVRSDDGRAESWNVVLERRESGPGGERGRITMDQTWVVSKHGYFECLGGSDFYIAKASEGFSGMWLTRFDLGTGKARWSGLLEASRPPHKKAANEGATFKLEDGFLWVFGRQAGKGFIELLDPGTGASLAHRIVEDGG